MGTYIIIAVLVLVVIFAARSGMKHMKGEGGCCGGGADEVIVEKKELQGKKIGEKVVHIEGMMCDNCRKHVEKQFNKIDGVVASVDWKKGIAVLSLSREVSDNEIRQALAWSDYKVTGIEPGKA
ncbi:MAG: heavy metal-associated domain-containing protein [Eubacteriales bacterium]|nr:heavy metal-associated domain-containing protein [Eubacteriales bacterium]